MFIECNYVSPKICILYLTYLFHIPDKKNTTYTKINEITDRMRCNVTELFWNNSVQLGYNFLSFHISAGFVLTDILSLLYICL